MPFPFITASAHPHMPARTDTEQHIHPQTSSRTLNSIPLTNPNYSTAQYVHGQGELTAL